MAVTVVSSVVSHLSMIYHTYDLCGNSHKVKQKQTVLGVNSQCKNRLVFIEMSKRSLCFRPERYKVRRVGQIDHDLSVDHDLDHLDLTLPL